MPTLWSAAWSRDTSRGYFPLTFQPGAQQGTVSVTRQPGAADADVEIYDSEAEPDAVQRTAWSWTASTTPPQEAQGRKLALNKLVSDIVDGAQSQW